MTQVPPEVLARPVAGFNLSAGTLAGQLAGPRTLLVFLRHLGCMFCREMVADLKAAAARVDGFPPVLLVSQSPAGPGADYFAAHWPAVRAIADPERTLYTAFGIGRADFLGLAGPMVWTCGVRAFAKGHRQDVTKTFKPAFGDPWLLSAMFLVGQDGAVDWCHRCRHAGERADFVGLDAFLSGPLSRVPTGTG